MFEKLNRARADYERNAKKLAEAQKKFDESAARLKKIETAAILDLVKTRSLTPEQLAEIVGEGETPIPTEATSLNEAPVVDVDFGNTKIDESEITKADEDISFAEAEKETDHEDEEDILDEDF